MDDTIRTKTLTQLVAKSQSYRRGRKDWGKSGIITITELLKKQINKIKQTKNKAICCKQIPMQKWKMKCVKKIAIHFLVIKMRMNFWGIYVWHILGCPTTNFGSSPRGQPHSTNANHYLLLTIFDSKVTGSLVMRLDPTDRSRA